jgi:phospholipase C
VRFAVLFAFFLSANLAHSLDIPAWKKIDRIMVVVLENTTFEMAKQQTFQKELASRGAVLQNYFALTHPSQPNYIGMIAGDTMSVYDDKTVNLSGTMLVDLLEKAGKTWKVYAEDYPGDAKTCFLGKKSGPYARKHIPQLNFTSVQKDPNRCAKVVNADSFASDVKNNALPNFVYYVPNLNNDGHDTTPTYADNALRKIFEPIVNNKVLMERTLLIVTYDEDDSEGPRNQIFTTLIGGSIQPGSKSTHKYDHYSLLRTIEEIFKLGSLDRNDATAVPILDVWKKD